MTQVLMLFFTTFFSLSWSMVTSETVDQNRSLASENQKEFQIGSPELFDETQQAAEKGDLVAQYHLGMLYSDHHGGRGNPEMATKWFKRAANQGHQRAQFFLGMMSRDQGDYVRAYKWFVIAQNQSSSAKARLKLVKEKMSSRQLKEAKKLVKEFKPKKEIPQNN